MIGDFDGDARTDFINVYVSKKCATVGINGVRSRKSAPDPITARTIIDVPVGSVGCAPTSWVADIDGDHRDDVITVFQERLYVSRFTSPFFRVDPIATPWKLTKCSVGDVDGDNRDDLVCLADRGNGPELVTAKSRGDATWDISAIPAGVPTLTPMAVGDINNDSLADIVLAPVIGATRSLVTRTSLGTGYASDTQWTPWAADGGDRLSTTDIDGDGLIDVVLMRATAGLKSEAALTIEGAPKDRYELRQLPQSSFDLADVDGDGRLDLVKGELAYLGDGTGGFASARTAFPPTSCTMSYYADTDGDGRTDQLCVFDDDYYFELSDYAPSIPANDLHRWKSGDIDGDGRDDYAYAFPINTGVGVLTILTSANRRVMWTQLPTATLPGLDESSAAHWILADVGSPRGTPDGKEDLVMVDTDGSRLRVYTMFSNGDGTFTPQVHENLNITHAPDLGNYWPLDVDGDGTMDLVHLAPSVSGVRVDQLLSRGDGTWTTSQKYYFQGATPRIVGATSFKPADLNGDGLVDLVHVYSGVGVTGTAIRALLNRGDGTFGEVSSVIASTHADTARWMTLDVNGDGTTDLLHASSTTTATASALTFDVLLSRGDGTFVQGAHPTVWLDGATSPHLKRGLESTAFLMPADLDGDRRADLWHISQYRDANGARGMLFVELRNLESGASWQAYAQTTGVPASAPWAWRAYRDVRRVDGTGIALIDGNAGVALLKDLPSERLARIDNGTGGSTTIKYKTQLAARAYLPASTVPTVVDEVTTLDYAYSPTLEHRTRYSYDGAMWSASRSHLNYRWIESTNSAATVATTYAVDEACGGTPLQTTTSDPVTTWTLGYTQRALVAAGTGPYVCLVQQEATYACQGGSCRRDALVDLTYDVYGNVVQSVAQITGAPTRTDIAPVWANTSDYVVDLPSYRAVWQDAGSGPAILRFDEYVYDGNNDAAAPVSTRGDVRTVRHFDSATQQYLESTFEYDANGLVKRTVDPAGTWVETEYDAALGAYPVRSCSVLGCVTSQFDTRFGVETRATDLNSNTTRYDYDAHGRLVTTTTPDGGSTTSRILASGTVGGVATPLRQRVRVETKDDSADGVLWSETLIDGTGRAYHTYQEGGAQQILEYRDASKRASRVSEVFTGPYAPPRYTSYTYDALGRMIEQRAADGSRKRWRYGVGTVETIDEIGRTRKLELDGAGQVTAVTDRFEGADIVATYGYDAMHRLVGTQDALGNTTSYYFDTLGRLIGESDPDRGLREYTHYANGRLRSSTDAKGQETEYRYDASGRPELRTDSVGGSPVRTVRWTYDELPGVGPLGASRGHVVRVDDDQQSTTLQSTYAYDAGGRVARDEQCIDGTCFTMERSYDIAGRIKDLRYPDPNNQLAETVNHKYNDAGKLVRVGDYLVDATYTLEGLNNSFKLGNGIETRWYRDPDRRWVDRVESQVYRATYTRDLTGTIQRLSEDAPTGAVTYQYTYDELGRVTDAVAGDPRLDRHFAYDEIGRITQHSELGKYEYTDPAHVHGVTKTSTGAERAYDRNGNATRLRDPSGRDLEITWTADDRPAEIRGSGGNYRMAYDASGSRVKKDGPSSARYFNSYLAIEDGIFVKYYFAGDMPIARRSKSDLTYYHQDHIRAVRATTDQSGSVVNSYQFDVYGAPIKRTTQNTDDIAFGSVHGDDDLGLVYMSARYYDPISARFVSADSVVRNALAPQALDRYAFVEGDPVNYIDPSGHMRRDIELMKERKEAWRALMVDYYEKLNNWCEPFCGVTPASTFVVWGKDGSVKFVAQPGDDASILAWQWRIANETEAARRAAAAATAGAKTTPAAAPSKQAPSPEGTTAPASADGGCSARSPAACVAELVLAAGPTKKTVSQPKGTTEEFSIAIDDPAFPGTVVTFIVTTDAYGKLTATAMCSGSCPMNFADSVKVQGEFVAVVLTRANGTIDITNKNGSDEKSSTQHGSSGGGSLTSKYEVTGKGDIPKVAELSGSGSLQGTAEYKRDATSGSSLGMTTDQSVTVSRVANVTSHVVMLHVTPSGADPAKGIQIIKGKVTGARDVGPDYSNWSK